jgi:hypothetical protein
MAIPIGHEKILPSNVHNIRHQTEILVRSSPNEVPENAKHCVEGSAIPCIDAV